MGHCSARIKNTKVGSEEANGAENEKQASKMEVDEVIPGMQSSSSGTDGDFLSCAKSKIGKRHVSKSKGPKKKGDTCGNVRKRRDHVCETLPISQMRLALYQVPECEPEENADCLVCN